MHRLRRRYGKVVGVAAEHALDGARLIDVVDSRRRTVGVHIVDVGRRQAAVIERHLHRRGRAFDRGVDHVGSVGRGAIAHELGENQGAACFGMLIFLKHQNAGALSEDGTVPLLGEREQAIRAQNAHGLPGPCRAPIE